MKITMKSTDQVVEVHAADGGVVPARVWEGVTAGGVPCQVLVTRVAVATSYDTDQFEAELQLQDHRPPAALPAFPNRLVL